jgi:intein/homing endonuclease
MKIEDLMYLSDEKIKVWSRDLVNGSDGFQSILAFAKTGSHAETIEIVDDVSGTRLVCTPEHLIYTKNRGYVEAKTLLETDELQIA